jgi:hypothetical protein
MESRRGEGGQLNHHDLWTLRGVGIKSEQFPMILGCDAAGVDTSTDAEVVVHGVVSSPDWTGDDTLDPGRTLLSEKHQGTLAERVAVPTRNLIPKPAGLSSPRRRLLTVMPHRHRGVVVTVRPEASRPVLVQAAPVVSEVRGGNGAMAGLGLRQRTCPRPAPAAWPGRARDCRARCLSG